MYIYYIYMYTYTYIYMYMIRFFHQANRKINDYCDYYAVTYKSYIKNNLIQGY